MVTRMYVSLSLLSTCFNGSTLLAPNPLFHGHKSCADPRLTKFAQRFFFGGVVVSKSTSGMAKRIRPRSLLQMKKRRHQNQQTRQANLRSGHRVYRGSSPLFFTVSCMQLTPSFGSSGHAKLLQVIRLRKTYRSEVCARLSETTLLSHRACL